MPRYLGKGANFHLISCEYIPLRNASKAEKNKVTQETCGNCGFFKDTMDRIMKRLEAYLASNGKRIQEVELNNVDVEDFNEWCKREGKNWRKLICVHPTDTVALNKWTLHITDWAVVPSV